MVFEVSFKKKKKKELAYNYLKPSHMYSIILLWKTQVCIPVKGVLHLLPQKAPKLAFFVLYLKIINIFLTNNIYILQ